MRLRWNNALEMAGIGFGYTSHQKQLRAGLERAGVEIADDADIAVSIVPAGNFEPMPGKFNVLYTMYESVDIPESWIPKVQAADLIVVPCFHNKMLFKRYTKKPVEVCWEGVDVEKFTYKERTFPEPGEPFVYLWFGASNERKGYVHMIAAWKQFRDKYPELIEKTRLVMKTTQLTEHQERIIGYDKGKPIKAEMPCERVFYAENAMVDTRRLPMVADGKLPGLVDVYHAAHCFVFPTMGEGFGLTLAEAMATGLPCIYTNWSGPVDFISKDEGYPLKWHYASVKAMTPMSDGTMRVDLDTHAASPEIYDIVHRMRQVYEDYDTAIKKGKKAAARIRKHITWDKSARSFMDIIAAYALREKVA